MAADGVTRAVEAAYRAHFDRVFAAARAATGRDEAFCMDIVQDAFVAYIRRSPRCGSDGELAAWLVTCVIRKGIDRIRAERRRGAREMAAGHAEARSVEGGDTAEWIGEQLRGLPASELELLGLKFSGTGAARSVAEAARGRGESVFAIHGKIRRIVQKLRERAMEMLS